MKQAILIGVCLNQDVNFKEHMKEMENLAEACDIAIVDTLIQNLNTINQRTYIGSGKIIELKNLLDENNCTLVICDKELSPSQQRNLQNTLNCEIIDKTALILNIFALRAQTKEAKIQVECARLKYMRPRLSGSYSHMDKQKGGNHNKGSGETKLELDTRNISSRIHELEKELKTIHTNRITQKRQRQKNEIKSVALCGYTNAGKSSIMNQFMTLCSKEEKQVLEKDMLFATLTTSTRKIKSNFHHEFLLSDTVGFVSDLPHHLIKAFHSTLEEVKDADLLLLVCDASSHEHQSHIEVTKHTLESIGAGFKETLYIYNKCDLCDITYPTRKDNKIYINAKDPNSIEFLLQIINETLFHDQKVQIHLPYEKGFLLSLLNQQAKVIKQEYYDTYIEIEAWVDDTLKNKIKPYIIA